MPLQIQRLPPFANAIRSINENRASIADLTFIEVGGTIVVPSAQNHYLAKEKIRDVLSILQ
jgi:hypothetical protein